MAAQLCFLCNSYSCSSSAASSPHQPFARSVATEFRKPYYCRVVATRKRLPFGANDDTQAA